MTPAATFTRFDLPLGSARLAVELDARLSDCVPEAWRSFRGGRAASPAAVVRLKAAPVDPTGQHHHFDAAGYLSAANFRIDRADVASPTGECVAHAAIVSLAARVAAEAACVRAGWLSAHASAVLVAGRVFAFAATSGTGKSTLGRRLREAGHERIADEATALSVDAGRLVATAHPGQLESARLGEVFPLGAVALLARGTEAPRALRGPAAVRELLKHLNVHDGSLEGGRLALALATQAVEEGRVWRLEVPNDDRAVTLARQLAGEVP